MRVELKKLLEKLGVNKELGPYETHPWLYYDDEQGITCSAEVRMGPDNGDLEAEIQFLHDEKDEDNEEDEETSSAGGIEQIMHLHAEPSADKQWSVKTLRVKNENYVNEIHDWEEKGCSFFKACVQAMQMSTMPNIEELTKKELHDGGKTGGGSGRVGRKSPKIKPGALLGMKKPGGGM